LTLGKQRHKLEQSAEGENTMARKKKPWSLLSSHGLVLVTVARFGDISVVEIAKKTGLSRSTVLHALKDLRNAGMLKSKKVGRRNSYMFMRDATFRHSIVRDTKIGDLLDIFTARAPR
jgi:DNA-binding transcriptional ArsR family regulator